MNTSDNCFTFCINSVASTCISDIYFFLPTFESFDHQLVMLNLQSLMFSTLCFFFFQTAPFCIDILKMRKKICLYFVVFFSLDRIRITKKSSRSSSYDNINKNKAEQQKWTDGINGRTVSRDLRTDKWFHFNNNLFSAFLFFLFVFALSSAFSWTWRPVF